MADLLVVAAVPLVLAAVASIVLIPAYLVWVALAWLNKRDGWQPTADREVRIEAIWGMVLALPIVVGGIFSAGEGSWGPLPWMQAAVLIVYAVATLALLSKPLVAPLRWAPAMYAVVALPANVAGGSANIGEVLELMAPFYLGYIAWCLVGVRFALAVGRRDRVAVAGSTPREPICTQV